MKSRFIQGDNSDELRSCLPMNADLTQHSSRAFVVMPVTLERNKWKICFPADQKCEKHVNA